jgi:energy-coupling factor transporter ATP-binding protein EcfA2
MEGVRLKRLKIDKYRNVAPGTELVFNDGFNVLLGKNGTGKTTLLRLIAAVVTGTFEHLKDDEFGLEYELTFPALRIIAAIRNEPRKERALTAPQTDNGPFGTSPLQSEPTWSCKITIVLGEGSSAANLCTISADPLSANLRFDGQDHKIGVQSPFEPNPLYIALNRLLGIISNAANAPNDMTRETRLSVGQRLWFAATLLETVTRNGGRFDEALGALDAITGVSSYDNAGDIDWACLGVLEDGRLNTTFSKFIPIHLYAAVSTKTRGDLAAGNLQIEHGSLQFLQKTVSILGVKSITLVVPLNIKTTLEGHNVFLYKNFEFLVTLADGTIISHKHLSYGQKRLLSFLYYAACNPDIVIADELVNGLHYEWIGTCLKEIQDRQSFLTSQNPVLLDMLPFESAEEVKRSFILCSHEARDDRGQMVWKTMSDESADMFYRAYETQALQVSEILRVNDLW